MTTSSKQRLASILHSKDWSLLMFLDCVKINGVSNTKFPLIIIVTFTGRTVIGFLADDESSCNVFYADTLEQQGPHRLYLSSSSGRDL